MDGNKKQLNSIRYRYIAVVAVLLLMVPALLYSIVRIQFVEGQAWRKWKEKQSRDSIEVAPLRGNIFSDDGALMATSMPTYNLYIDFMAYVGNGKMPKARVDSARKAYKDSLYKYVKPLSAKLSAKFEDKSAEQYERDILAGFERGRRSFIVSRKRVDYLTYQEIKKYPFFNLGKNRSGLHEKQFLEREKIFGTLASSLVGFVNPETGRGSYGLEHAYDTLLCGESGLCSRQRVGDRYMNVVTKEPRNGYDVYTTIDLPIQDIVEKSLREAMDQYTPEYGTAILMEVKTGRIRAMSNLERTKDGFYVENKNIAVCDRSEPGSTFKTVAMMACLEEHRVKPTDIVDTGNGVKTFYGRSMKDDHQCGVITAEGVIHQSSNVGMATLADNGFNHGKDSKNFVDRIYKMGFQQNLHLELSDAAVPKIPHPGDAKRYWSKTDLPWMSIGYVVAIPPIYTISYYNAIANNGCYVRPYFVDRIQRGDEIIEQFEPTVMTKKICSDSTLAIIRQMLDSVPIKGTAKKAHSDIVEIAGKTGTAVLDYSGGDRGHQASFCAYFPAHNPEYTCLVVIRRPHGAYSGGTVAAPVVKRIAEQVYSREHRLELKDLALKETVDGVNSDGKEVVLKAKPLALDDEARDMGIDKVPDVSGLGLKDAICRLEESGLRAYVQGHGHVAHQTPKAGTACRAGQTVEIVLR